jgi:hypothetical protein
VTVPAPAPAPQAQDRSTSTGRLQLGMRELRELLGGLKPTIAKAVDASRAEITGAVAELLDEISDSTKQVRRVLQAEAMTLRGELGQIVGNGGPAAD